MGRYTQIDKQIAHTSACWTKNWLPSYPQKMPGQVGAEGMGDAGARRGEMCDDVREGTGQG